MSYTNADAPIFIRGVSRSGGTLLVTLLDSHSWIAMSYELYPSLLLHYRKPAAIEERAEYNGMLSSNAPHDASSLVTLLERCGDLKHALKQVTDRNLRTYLARCQRSGLSSKALAGLLKRYLEAGLDFTSSLGRMRFMEACCRGKMLNERKRRWGLKCSNQFEDYFSVWPDAAFINVVRDGRDVLASQLTTGSFDKAPEQIGQGWAHTHRKFRGFARSNGARTMEVYYEQLVRAPEKQIQMICEFLGIPFESTMLSYYRQQLTIYSASHLSMDRITKPIDDTRIGRWRKDVTADQLSRFMSSAREMMTELGYS